MSENSWDFYKALNKGNPGAIQNEQDFWNQSLWDYAGLGDTYKMKEALDYGANVNWEERNYRGDSMGTALEEAVHEGHPNAVQLLIEHGAVISFDTLEAGCGSSAALMKCSTDPLAIYEMGGGEAVLNKMMKAESIAVMLIDAAPKGSFVGVDGRAQTLVEIADEASGNVRKALREALAKHGLTEASLKPAARPPSNKPKGPRL